jgi:hypothetical protein
MAVLASAYMCGSRCRYRTTLQRTDASQMNATDVMLAEPGTAQSKSMVDENQLHTKEGCLTMSPLLPPPRLPGCSARSMSFLLGPDGPAGAPPGQDLRPAALIGLRENPGSRNNIRITKSPRFEENPALASGFRLAAARA